MLARMRALDPFKADLLLAAVFLVEALGELVVLVPDGAPHRWGAALLIVVEAAALALRRRYTVLAVLVVMPFQVLAYQLGSAYSDHLVTPFFVVLLMLYTIGRHLEGPAMLALGVYAGGFLLWANASDDYADTATDYLVTAALLIAAPIIVGRVVRHRSRLHRTLRDKRERLEQERVVSAAAAA